MYAGIVFKDQQFAQLHGCASIRQAIWQSSVESMRYLLQHSCCIRCNDSLQHVIEVSGPMLGYQTNVQGSEAGSDLSDLRSQKVFGVSQAMHGDVFTSSMWPFFPSMHVGRGMTIVSRHIDTECQGTRWTCTRVVQLFKALYRAEPTMSAICRSRDQ